MGGLGRDFLGRSAHGIVGLRSLEFLWKNRLEAVELESNVLRDVYLATR